MPLNVQNSNTDAPAYKIYLEMRWHIFKFAI